MDAKEFLRLIWADEGAHCVISIKNGKVRHNFYDQINVAAERAIAADKSECDVYYAMAMFSDGTDRRLQANVEALKCFYVDLDCGKGKEYRNQQEAYDSLYYFIDKTNLPEPYVVNSGYGLHVYWVLDESIDPDTWKDYAFKLAAAADKFDLFVDTSCTMDSARILRVPGTRNHKDPDDPKPVIVEQVSDTYPFRTIKDALDSLDLPARKKRQKLDRAQMSSTMKALIGDKQSRFSTIAKKSLKGVGCAFIKHAIIKQAELEEPLWRAALSIAYNCVDGDKAIHKISCKHKEYDPEETLSKASMTTGPYFCETIATIDSAHCEGCKFKGEISSPIQLGSEIAKAEALPEMPKADSEAAKSLFSQGEEEEPAAAPKPPQMSAQVQQANYSPPPPYIIAKSGAIYAEVSNKDGEVENVLVYEHPFYAVSRIKDPTYGECVLFRVHLPLDGVREFVTPAATVMSSEKFKSELGKYGVVGGQEQMRRIMEYSIRYVKELQHTIKAVDARTQFGWADNDETFIVGDRAYKADGTFEPCPPSSVTEPLIDMFKPKGDLNTWKSIINALGLEGMEPLQFAALSGFGSPLIKFTGVKGATINLMSEDSGSGKSTSERIAMSVFGSPESELKMADTHMSKMNRFGIMNNLCLMSDEMTNLPPEQVSSLLYQVTDGRGRHRMERDANIERINTTTWELLFLVNSNSSMVSKLRKLKSRADGEMMRLLELTVKKVEVPNGFEIFSRLNSNYGVAGEIYAPWLVKNRDRLINMIELQRKKLEAKLQHRQEERFWIAVASAVLVGAKAAKHLGLHDLDTDKLEAWVIEEIKRQRTGVKDNTSTAEDLVGNFLLEKAGQVLVIGTKKNAQTGTLAENNPQVVVARLEKGPRRMYISKKAFQDYCTERQFTMEQALRHLETSTDLKYENTVRKRMMANTGNSGVPAVPALEFSCDPSAFEDAIPTNGQREQRGH